MGTLCFMVHSKRASRTSGGSMDRLALARAVPSEIRRCTAYDVSVHIMLPHSDGAGVGIRWDVARPASIYASHTPQTDRLGQCR